MLCIHITDRGRIREIRGYALMHFHLVFISSRQTGTATRQVCLNLSNYDEQNLGSEHPSCQFVMLATPVGRGGSANAARTVNSNANWPEICVHRSRFAFTKARISDPYLASFLGPMPLTASSALSLRGRCAAMLRRSAL